MTKIVFLQSSSLGKDVDLSHFNQLGEVVFYPEVSQDQVINYAKEAEIVITNKNIFDKEVIDQCPCLKMIAITATGVNNVDIHYAHQKGIRVANVSGYSTEAVAQHTIALALHLGLNLSHYDDYVKSQQYAQSGSFSYFGRSFHNFSSLKWGIVGLGNIGRKVAQIATSLGAEVSYYSTSGVIRKEDYPQVDLETLLTQSDIISLHAPLNENTHYMFNKEAFEKMKTNALLINVARGPLVNEKDLAWAINNNEIAGAGLDVFEVEPLPASSPLYTINDFDKIIMTPHVAWASIEARKKLVEEVYLNIEAFLNGEERNIVL